MIGIGKQLLLYSKATSDDITSNRVSNTLLKEALRDPTPAAYNPFSAGGIVTSREYLLMYTEKVLAHWL